MKAFERELKKFLKAHGIWQYVFAAITTDGSHVTATDSNMLARMAMIQDMVSEINLAAEKKAKRLKAKKPKTTNPR